MDTPYITDFLLLRGEGKIGRIWPPDPTREEGKRGWMLEPDGTLPMMGWRMAEPITEEGLRMEIDRRMGRPQKKEVARVRWEDVYAVDAMKRRMAGVKRQW